MPEILRKKIDDHTLYAVWEITESSGELLKMIRFRGKEQELFESFVAENRRKQWLAYRILIRALISPGDFPVEYDTTGKPFLAGGHHHISVTHSENLAAVIISSRALVGIDIELVRPRIAKIREKFLHPEESDFIGNRNLGLLTLAWCAKEALYKLYGHPGLDFRENIRLCLPASTYTGKFQGEIIHNGNRKNYTLYNDNFGEYILVYVLELPDLPGSADVLQ